MLPPFLPTISPFGRRAGTVFVIFTLSVLHTASATGRVLRGDLWTEYRWGPSPASLEEVFPPAWISEFRWDVIAAFSQELSLIRYPNPRSWQEGNVWVLSLKAEVIKTGWIHYFRSSRASILTAFTQSGKWSPCTEEVVSASRPSSAPRPSAPPLPRARGTGGCWLCWLCRHRAFPFQQRGSVRLCWTEKWSACGPEPATFNLRNFGWVHWHVWCKPCPGEILSLIEHWVCL